METKYKLAISIASLAISVILIKVSFYICHDILKFHGDTHCIEAYAERAAGLFFVAVLGTIISLIVSAYFLILLVVKSTKNWREWL